MDGAAGDETAQVIIHPFIKAEGAGGGHRAVLGHGQVKVSGAHLQSAGGINRISVRRGRTQESLKRCNYHSQDRGGSRGWEPARTPHCYKSYDHWRRPPPANRWSGRYPYYLREFAASKALPDHHRDRCRQRLNPAVAEVLEISST